MMASNDGFNATRNKNRSHTAVHKYSAFIAVNRTKGDGSTVMVISLT